MNPNFNYLCCNLRSMTHDIILQMQDSRKGCNYCLWFDPPLCPRLKAIIPRLLRKAEKLEVELCSKEKGKDVLHGVPSDVSDMIFFQVKYNCLGS